LRAWFAGPIAYSSFDLKKFASYFLLFSLLGRGLTADEYRAWNLAGEVVSTFEPQVVERTSKTMVEAAQAWLESLSAEEKSQLLLPLNDGERKKWTNLPTRPGDGGLRLGDLDKDSLERACIFLATVLSAEGYNKVTEVMLADDTLIKSEKQAERRGGFGTANFWLVIFGEPSLSEPWAVQLDGHHIAFNLTILGDRVTMSPSFIGTQPHKITLKGKEIVPMGDETAAAFEFMASLNEEQRSKAIQGDKRRQLELGPGEDGVKPKARGLACEDLNQKQKGALMKLISLWIDDLPKSSFERRREEIAAQLDETFFLWEGPHQPGSDASFHIFGPSVIIEYAGQNLGGDPLNHLHSIYRDPSNEYGRRWVGN